MGVTDFAFMYCRVCKRHTVHITDWDAESPNKLWTECLEHQNHSYDVPVAGFIPEVCAILCESDSQLGLGLKQYEEQQAIKEAAGWKRW